MHTIPRPIAALVAAGILACPLLPASAAAQLDAGSTLVVRGAADAVDVGSAGVRLTATAPLIVDAAASTGSFVTLAGVPGGTTATLATFLVGAGPQSVPGLLTAGPFTFTLTGLQSGAYGQADCYVAPIAGQRCTPYQFPGLDLSPFQLENAGVGSDGMLAALIAFDVQGTVSVGGMTALFTGTVASAFTGVSYQEALFGLEQYGLQGVPFTATFVVGDPIATVTPEPATIALMAGGLAGVGLIARRRTRRRER